MQNRQNSIFHSAPSLHATLSKLKFPTPLYKEKWKKKRKKMKLKKTEKKIEKKNREDDDDEHL